MSETTTPISEERDRGIILDDLNQLTGLERAVQRKVFFVVDEAVANILKNNRVNPDLPTDGQSVTISNGEDEVTITTVNTVTKAIQKRLEETLNRINHIDSDELKELFTDVINNEETTEGGGAGLGFIQMARKTQNKLEHKFKDIDDNLSQFIFTSTVTKR